MVIASQVVAPRAAGAANMKLAGARLFVPLIGFNALYRWGSGEGQTSASFLVGRDDRGEKLAPLRLDMVRQASSTRLGHAAASAGAPPVGGLERGSGRIIAVPGEHGGGTAVRAPGLGQLAHLLLARPFGVAEQAAELDLDRKVAGREERRRGLRRTADRFPPTSGRCP